MALFMRILIKYLFISIVSLQSYVALSADESTEKKAISTQARAFSKAFVNGDADAIMAIYSPNARIVDVNSKIESDISSIRKFWTPNNSSKWQLLSHQVTSEELIIEGNMASDIGYYKGVTRHQDGRKVTFSGAYVIVWLKINGTWRMHLDMWNAIK